MIAMVLIALCAMTVNGQNQILQKINDIKSQSDIYYWSQFAHPNADTARVSAVRWILIDINEKRSDSDQLTVRDIENKVKHIKMERGGVVRDFVYIAKADIDPKGQIVTPVIIMEDDKEFVPEMFVQRVMQYKTFEAVYRFLRSQKAEGVVQMFGPLSEVDDYDSLDLIIFDLNSKEVITVLSGVTQGSSRTNLVNGTADSLDNYPEDMIAAIYYIK